MRRCMLAVFCLLIGGILAGCSKLSVEDKDGKGEGPESTASCVTTNDYLQIGDVIEGHMPSDDNPDKVGVEYIINETKLYDTPEAAGIERDKLINCHLCCQVPQIMETNEAIELSNQEVDKNKLLVAKVNIKNLDANMNELVITTLSLVYANPDTNEIEWVWEPAYFSGTKAETTDDTEYYHYKLAKGKSIDTEIAWLVDESKFDLDNIYLVNDYLGDKQETVKLDIKQ